MRFEVLALALLTAGCALGGPPNVARDQIRYDTRATYERLRPIVSSLSFDNAELCRDTVGTYRAPDGREACAFGVGMVNRPEANAFTNGETLYLTPALLREAETDGQLAGLIAHELAHAIRRHVFYKRLAWTVGTVLDIVVAGGTGVSTGGALGQAATVAFSQQREREADELGCWLMARAGYDPLDLAAFWERRGDGGGGGWFDTHPAHADRAENVRRIDAAIVAKLRARQPLLPD